MEQLNAILAECTPEERRAIKSYIGGVEPHPLETEWEIDADTILTAIRRSSDLTKRGVRGIIAEAVFENSVIPQIAEHGWHPIAITGDQSYDVHLRKGEIAARIQIKLQRLEQGLPKLYFPKFYSGLYVVEVQRTRTGERSSTAPGSEAGTSSATVQTRPYRFGDFDILAVNMHPSSRNWRSFRYTVGSWLLPRAVDSNLIEVFQPVASDPDEVWTADLAECLRWFESGVKRSVLANVLHRSKSS